MTWESVRTAHHGRSSIVYWRLKGATRHLGAVSRRTSDDHTAYRDADTAYWRALIYGPDHRRNSGDRQELGRFPSKRAAMQAVETHPHKEPQ